MRKLFPALLATLWPLTAFAQTAPAPQGTAALVCAYNSSPPTLSSGTFGYVQCDSSGRVVTSIVINSTRIIGGTNTRVLYDNNGTVGEYPITGTGSVVMSASPTLSPAANSVGLMILGGSITGSSTVAPGISITGTLNTSGVVDGAAIFANITNTASGASSFLADLQVGGSSQFSVDMSGNVITTGGLRVGNGGSNLTAANAFWCGGCSLFWIGAGAITSAASNTISIGGADSGSPVAETLKFQAGSGTNISGQNATILASLSTGNATNPDLIFQTGIKTTSGAGTASPTTAMTIKGETQLVALNAITSDATHTDATICEDTTTHALYSGSGTLGICLGTSSRRYKHDEADLGLGRVEIMGLRPKSYRLNASHGDPSKLYYGFMAEDAIGVLPGLVGLDVDGRPNTMDYLGIVPVLTRAFQEHDETIESLKARVAALEEKLERRTAWIDAIPVQSPSSLPSAIARPYSLH